MTSPPMSLLPPYTLPLAHASLDPAPNVAGLPLRLPYVPPVARPSTVLPPDRAALLEAPAVPEAAVELPSISDFLAAGAVPVPGDERWPIAEVGAEVTRLAERLRLPVESTPAPEPMSRVPAADRDAGERHEPWAEDEQWMDIMPALPALRDRDLEAETAWARAFAEPPAPLVPPPPAGDASLAARALEAVARRLRAGELALPTYAADGGEAAALAATLTALLGSRR